MFNMFKKKEQEVSTPPSPEATISLEKRKVILDKTLIDIGIKEDHKCQVVLCIDNSYSMNSLYKQGRVQELLDKLVPLSLRFDDNGELDVKVFNNKFYNLDTTVTINNYTTYVDKFIKPLEMGGTIYSSVLKTIYNEGEKSSLPTYVLFITDGECSDRNDFFHVIDRNLGSKVFVQFTGIGTARFDTLEMVDSKYPDKDQGIDFIKIADIMNMDEATLYNRLLIQYKEWLTVNNY